jgi:ornithine cyclodeaminase/alanine dehydrogenase-like protein (mu-crystallin family)
MAASQALLLNASLVDRLIDDEKLLVALREAMSSYVPETGIRGQRAHSALPGMPPKSTMVIFPGLIPGISAYTVKVNAKLPHATPSVLGLVSLHDIDTGNVLAVMDSIVITARRTALVGALAADVLARDRLDRVAVIGAGTQGRAQLRALQLVRNFDRVRAFDTDATRARRFAEEMTVELNVPVEIATTVADTVAGADLIITATWAKTPFLSLDMVKPGAHITAVGADEPGKGELSASLLLGSRFVADDDLLALEMGALAGAGLGRSALAATLGEVLRGEKPGRSHDRDITVFGSVGLPCQDLATAWLVFQRARKEGLGTSFAFHA